MIYFAEILEGGDVEPGTIKIGYTARMTGRLPQLEYRFGCRVRILGVIAGDRSVEAWAHDRFMDERIGREELFKPSPRLLSYIHKNARRWSPELDRNRDFDRTFDFMYSGTSIEDHPLSPTHSRDLIETDGLDPLLN